MTRRMIAQMAGQSYDNIDNMFFINDVSDLAGFLNGSTYELPEGHYTFASAIDFGTNNIDLITTNGCYRFTAACTLGVNSYTGVSSFMTTSTTGINLFLDNITFSTPNATCIDMANGGTFFCHVVNFIASKVANLNAFGFATLETVAMVFCGDGMTFTNMTDKIAGIEVQWNDGANTSGNALRVAGTTPPIISFTGVDSRPAATESMFYFENTWTGDAVVTNGVHSTSTGGVFLNASGKDQTDVDVLVRDVRNVANSAYAASMHMTGNSTETVISATDTPVKIAGTFTEVFAQRFTTDSTGRITYIGKEDITVGSSVVATIDPAGGGTDTVDCYIAKNGTVIATSKGETNASSGSQIGSVASVPLTNGDYLEGFIANASDTSNLTATTLTFSVGG